MPNRTLNRLASRPIVLVAGALAACAPAGATVPQEVPGVERAEVERLVTTLASDEMRGRAAFTEDARRAAAFLAEEFRAAGLESPPGAEGYLQRFGVRTISPGEATVVVNGRPLFPNQFAMRLGAGPIEWSTGDVPVIAIGAEEEPLPIVMSVANAGFDALVLMNEQHGETFRQFVQIFRRPVRTLADAVGATVVIALVNAEQDATYSVVAEATVEDEEGVNVVGTLPGRRADEYVLFSAHYDHLGIERPFRGDSIANGANDDASGTAAVVTLARHFARLGTPERTLLFAAFTGEEEGGFGSRHFSRQLDPDRIVAMFNIEMIGKVGPHGPNTAWITGFERSSFGAILQRAVEGTGYAFHPDPYPSYGLFYRSDNATLARLGVPAHSISTTPIDVDPDYHRVTDEVATLDLDHLTSTIR
ncbi:MAG TPA: M20/M25/M40 family metallo-hydrolase, partial [Longimicrobiales bacterium]|nr:M20/M25/M40 family metallo-hydrolase [Longimicrobiales bacterium]